MFADFRRRTTGKDIPRNVQIKAIRLDPKNEYACYYHPDRDGFVDVGKDGRHFYVCWECYKRDKRKEWEKDQQIVFMKGMKTVV